jgi:cytochrome P450
LNADHAVLPRPPRLRLAQALHAAVDPEGFFRHGARRGEPFAVRLPGVGTVYVTGHPDGAREIFTADPAGYETVQANPIEALLGPGSLILLAGERHARERRLLVPPFHGDRMRAYGRIIQDVVGAELARLAPGAAVSAQALMQAVTLQVIVRAVFGVEGDARRAQVHAAVTEMLDAYSPALMLVPGLRRELFGRGPWARFVRAREAFDRLLLGEVAARRVAPGAAGEDILSLLVAVRDEDGRPLADAELLDELRTLLVAGHETTATVLCWALPYLHRQPEELARLRAELDALGPSPAAEALAAAPYLGAVANEALRLHPVVPIVLRRLRAPLTLRGHRLAAGDSVAVAVSLLHAREDVFPEPARFRPERFLERRYSPFEHAPFGGGHRRCLGAAFAAYELRLVLGTLLSRARLHLDAASARGALRPVLRSITAAPARPIGLVYEGPRAQAAE